MNITASGTANVDQATTIQGASNTGTSTISAITSARIAGSTNAVVAIGTTVTANTAATAAQANTIGGFAAVVCSVSDTAEAIAGASDAARDDAVNITATSAATVDQATTIESASNSGSNTHDIMIVPRTLLDPPEVLTLGGTVTANTAATAAQATTIASYEKEVVYSVSDIAEAIAALGAPARNEAGTSLHPKMPTSIKRQQFRVSQTGTSTISAITDSAENLAGSTNAVVAIGMTVTANTAAMQLRPTPLAALPRKSFTA